MKPAGYVARHMIGRWQLELGNEPSEFWEPAYTGVGPYDPPYLFVGFMLPDDSSKQSGQIYTDRDTAGTNAKPLWIKQETPAIPEPSIQEQINNLAMRLEALEKQPRGRRKHRPKSDIKYITLGPRLRLAYAKEVWSVGKINRTDTNELTVTLTLEADHAE